MNDEDNRKSVERYKKAISEALDAVDLEMGAAGPSKTLQLDRERLQAITEEILEMEASGMAHVLHFSSLKFFYLLSQLQLSLRHPHNTGASAELARAVVRDSIEDFAAYPTLHALLLEGNDPAFDVASDPVAQALQVQKETLH